MPRGKGLGRWRETYAEVRVPAHTRTEFAYLAGIIDGEGSFQVSMRSNTFGLGVSVTDRCLVEWLAEHFGGSAYYDISSTSAKRKVHRWFMHRHADLGYTLPRLLPYLTIKKQQARAMIALVKHLGNYPEYEVPTSRSPKRERDRRRKIASRWRMRGNELRLAVRAARYDN